MSTIMSQNFMTIGQLVQELSPKNLFSDLVLYRVALMALLAGIWLNLLLLVVATRSIWNFEHRITRKKVIGGSHGKDPRCMLATTIPIEKYGFKMLLTKLMNIIT